MENLLIEIGANTKEFLKGLTEVGEKTGSLGDKLVSIGAVAATAFAGYTASIMGAVYAYREEEKIGQEVQAILRSTGGVAGVTAEAMNEYAESLSRATTFAKDQVMRGEEILLTFTRIGKETFPQATQATLDLAQRLGTDAAGAAQVLGRALQDPQDGMTQLRRAGVLFTAQQKDQIETMLAVGNTAGAQAVILKQVESQYGGMAQAAAGGTGQVVILKNVLEDFVEALGEQFAPYVEMGARKLIELVRAAQEHEGLVKFIAAVTAAGAAVTGVITTLVAGTLAFQKLSSTMEITRGVMTALGISTRTLVGSTGLGLLLIVAYEIYEHWNQIWPTMQAVYKAFVDNVGNAAKGLFKILQGAFSLDLGLIREGLAQAASAFAEGAKKVGQAFQPKVELSSETKATAEKAGRDLATIEAAARARQLMAEEDRTRRLQHQAQLVANQATVLELQHHTTQVVALKKKEAELLKQLADQKFKGDKKALQVALKETQKQYADAYKAEAQAKKTLTTQLLANDRTFQSLSKTEQAQYLAEHQAQLVASIQNEEQAKEANLTKDLEREIAHHNTMLQEQQRYGTAYAKINAAMHEAVLQDTNKGFETLSQLTQSGNDTLKTVGKAAASEQAAMKTAEGAISAYASLAGIPIVGPGLGAIAAGALIAYGVEQQEKIWAANVGGMVPYTSGVPGQDSVPALLTPGELVVPEKSYDDVVDAAASRKLASQGNGAVQNGPAQYKDVVVRVEVDLSKNAARLIQVRTVQDQSMGTYRGSNS